MSQRPEGLKVVPAQTQEFICGLLAKDTSLLVGRGCGDDGISALKAVPFYKGAHMTISSSIESLLCQKIVCRQC